MGLSEDGRWGVGWRTAWRPAVRAGRGLRWGVPGSSEQEDAESLPPCAGTASLATQWQVGGGERTKREGRRGGGDREGEGGRGGGERLGRPLLPRCAVGPPGGAVAPRSRAGSRAATETPLSCLERPRKRRGSARRGRFRLLLGGVGGGGVAEALRAEATGGGPWVSELGEAAVRGDCGGPGPRAGAGSGPRKGQASASLHPLQLCARLRLLARSAVKYSPGVPGQPDAGRDLGAGLGRRPSDGEMGRELWQRRWRGPQRWGSRCGSEGNPFRLIFLKCLSNVHLEERPSQWVRLKGPGQPKAAEGNKLSPVTGAPLA